MAASTATLLFSVSSSIVIMVTSQRIPRGRGKEIPPPLSTRSSTGGLRPFPRAASPAGVTKRPPPARKASKRNVAADSRALEEVEYPTPGDAPATGDNDTVQRQLEDLTAVVSRLVAAQALHPPSAQAPFPPQAGPP